MKLRIHGNSFRFRIDARDLDLLLAGGAVETHSQVPSGGGLKKLTWGVAVSVDADQTSLDLQPFEIRLSLSGSDLDVLRNPSREGVSLRRGWKDDEGLEGVTEILIEKDRLSAWNGESEA